MDAEVQEVAVLLTLDLRRINERLRSTFRDTREREMATVSERHVPCLISKVSKE